MTLDNDAPLGMAHEMKCLEEENERLRRELAEARKDGERLAGVVRYTYAVFSDRNFTDRFDDAERMKRALDLHAAARKGDTDGTVSAEDAEMMRAAWNASRGIK